MECPSCGADSDITFGYSECDPRNNDLLHNQVYQEPLKEKMSQLVEAEDGQNARKSSTLIEFPGVVRPSIPEWRRELSERVRELQERRAREAALEAEAIAQAKIESGSTPQLELLPQVEIPEINPLVAAALKRIERAHQSNPPEDRRSRATMTAVAYAPALEPDNSLEEEVASIPQLEFDAVSELDSITEETVSEIESKPERNHCLVVVAPPPAVTPVKNPPVPKRLIVDDPNDPALNYLDSISRNLCVDELDKRRASSFRRIVCALIDVLVCALLSAPIAGAIQLTGNSLQDRRAIIVVAASFVVMTFLYQTLTIALTGRTLAMRLLSLRIIDRKTGLIPTGGQAAGRAFLYMVSVGVAGTGILFALVSREGHTVHDQFTRTEVVIT